MNDCTSSKSEKQAILCRKPHDFSNFFTFLLQSSPLSAAHPALPLRFREPEPRLTGGQLADEVTVDQPQLHGLFQRGQPFRAAFLADEVDAALRPEPAQGGREVTAGGNVLRVLRRIGKVGLQQQQIRLLGHALPDRVVAVVREDAERLAAAERTQPIRRAAGPCRSCEAGRRTRQGKGLRRSSPLEQAHTAAPCLRAASGSFVPHSGQYSATSVTATPQPGQQRWRER